MHLRALAFAECLGLRELDVVLNAAKCIKFCDAVSSLVCACRPNFIENFFSGVRYGGPGVAFGSNEVTFSKEVRALESSYSCSRAAPRGCEQLQCMVSIDHTNFSECPPPRNVCVTYTHGTGVVMGGRGLWDYHGPRVCVV